MDNNDQRILIHENMIHGIVMNNVIEAFETVSEGLLIAFENCEAQDRPLSQIQQTDILQCVFFCMRTLEQEMKSSANFSLSLARIAEEDPDFIDRIQEDFDA